MRAIAALHTYRLRSPFDTQNDKRHETTALLLTAFPDRLFELTPQAVLQRMRQRCSAGWAAW